MAKATITARIVLQYAFMPLMTVYLEVLLRLLTGGKAWQGIPYAIFFMLAAGFLLSLILAFIPKRLIWRITGAVLLGVLSTVYALQYFMYQSFKVFLSIGAIIIEAANVIGVFTDTFIMTILRGMPFIIIFFMPLILFLIITAKRFPLYSENEAVTYDITLYQASRAGEPSRIRGALQKLLRITPVTVAVAGLLLAAAGQIITLSTNRGNKAAFYAEYNFDTTSRRLGVLPGVCLEMWYGIFGSPLDTAAFSLSAAQEMPVMEIPRLTITETPATEEYSKERETGSEDRNISTSKITPAPASRAETDAPGSGEDGGSPDNENNQEPDTDSNSRQGETIPIDYGYNVTDIDFEALIEAEHEARIREMHEYVSALMPSRRNAYTGLFEGKNLIIICAEAFTTQVVDRVMTPVLYRLVHNGIYFSDFYQPTWGAGTAGGEFAILSGFPPTEGSASTLVAAQHNCGYMIGNRLRNLGYFSAAYHNGAYVYYSRNESHEQFGYETFQAVGFGIDGYEKLSWAGSDLEMMELSIPHYIDRQPFSVYYMTVSGHSPYTFENNMANKNWDAFPRQFGRMSDTIRAYMATNMELEYALRHLVGELENAGIADDTVIVLATDHFPYGLEMSVTWESNRDYLEELFGHPVRTDADRDSNSLILWSGSLENKHKDMAVEISSPASTIDILPTLLNLFGLEFDSRMFPGRDVFSDAVPLVFWFNRSWKTDAGYFDARSNEFTPASIDIAPTDEYIAAVRAVVNNKISYANSVLSRNYLDIFYNPGGTLKELSKNTDD